MNKKSFVENIKNKWLSRKKDKDFWEQFQGLSNEVSEGIYAEDNHFIYELIQNAEDTESVEKVHRLEFVLEENGLVIINNESGFTEEQVNAICAFKKSTKSKNKDKGFIGEKGIGFKSVFKITDRPAIYSNGYRFYFQRQDEDGVTEYIIPHWIEDDELLQYPKKFQENTHTTLYLPFDTSKKESSIARLREDIKQIEPILLLFLNRLDNIRIYEDDEQLINTTKSSKKLDNIKVVTIKNDLTHDKYYIFKKSIKVDMTLDEVAEKDGRRKDVKEREIIIAFPDKKNETLEDRVFAFLPTNLRSRLGFIIQADFILQSGRENITIDSEWNKWQLNEIRDFIVKEVVPSFQKNNKLKMSYLNYFSRRGESDNPLINNMYRSLMEMLYKDTILLGADEKWHKTQNILLVDYYDVNIDSKHLKLLFGNNFEQLHSNFQAPEQLINYFNIRRISRQEIIQKIVDYFVGTSLNSINKDVVFNLTVFLAKYNAVDSRSREHDRALFRKISTVLPIIPKYENSSMYYYPIDIYLSEEFSPDFFLENLFDTQHFEFKYFNFLSPVYFNDQHKGVENYIRKILKELREDNNRRTIEFLSKYPDLLHAYIQKNPKLHYQRLLDFLINNQKDNLSWIAKIPLVLTTSDQFLPGNTEDTVYFPTSTVDESLYVLHPVLHDLTQKNKEYKELFLNIFNVKEADIHNIILHDYLPWFEKNRHERNDENDKKVIEYTELIIKHLEDFERDEIHQITNKVLFISTNNRNRYLKSSNIYLTQNLSQMYLNEDSIERYINNTEYFDFISPKYDQMFPLLSDENIKEFLHRFKFIAHKIKENDLEIFLRWMSKDLELDQSTSALSLIVKSEDFIKYITKIDGIENIRLFSNDEKLLEMKNLLIETVAGLPLPTVHDAYRKKIDFTRNKKIRSYFQSPYRIEPLIKYLQNCNSLNEAIAIYEYMDEVTTDVSISKENSITSEKIRLEFSKSPLIVDGDGNRKYPNEVVWTQQQSGKPTLALAEIYPLHLQKFFIQKVQVSQHRGIKQIVDQIDKLETKNQEYFNLLVDLGQLVIQNDEINKYRKSFKNSIDREYISNNVQKNARMFLSEKEKLFITDNNKKVSGTTIYINDMDLDVPADLRSIVLTLKFYGNHAFDDLFAELEIKKLSLLKRVSEVRSIRYEYDILKYRQLLSFAYDLLFTKYYDEYTLLFDRRDDLMKVNDVDRVIIVADIQSIVILNGIDIVIENERYYFNTDQKTLYIENEKYISKAIADMIKGISDKDIKDFNKEVVLGGMSLAEYYQEEGIKEKQDFYLEISSRVFQKESQVIDAIGITTKQEDFTTDIVKEEDSKDKKFTPEERQEQLRMSGVSDILSYESGVENSNPNIEPVSSDTHITHNINHFIREQEEKVQKVRAGKKKKNKSIKHKESLPTHLSYRIGEEETKEFFRRRDQYAGCCQICGFTFRTKTGQNYCERFTWTDGRKSKRIASVIIPGNSLCLCGRCNSIIQGGGDFKAKFLEGFDDIETLDEFILLFDGQEIADVPEIFKDHIDFDDMFTLPIKLNNKSENIYFTDEHITQFFAFLTE